MRNAEKTFEWLWAAIAVEQDHTWEALGFVIGIAYLCRFAPPTVGA